jgi:hypothetical protein
MRGEMAVEGLVPWGSNYTFLVNICEGPLTLQAIYKPQRGERPLWDFEAGTLCLRERAAYLLALALGWQLVPPTILREGPHGYGSVQLFIEHDPDANYFTFEGQFPEQMQQIQLLDVVINNADRKGGHILLDADQRLWAIDHGVCFHAQYKLRSVVWEYAGLPVADPLLADLRQLQIILSDGADPLRKELQTLLTNREMAALGTRVARLLESRIFPEPGPGRPYPWPLV